MSPKGARGLMQVMPHMVRPMGMVGNLSTIETNIEAGCIILADNIRRLGEADGISAYFWGSEIRGDGYLERVRAARAGLRERLDLFLSRSRSPCPRWATPSAPIRARVETPPARRRSAARRAPLLFRRAWLPPSAVGRRSLVVHGYAEHSGRYEELGAWFAARGLAVHAYDQRGHGRSEGARCHVDRFGDYLDDLDRVLARVRDEHPELPCVLVGHSMGGLVVCAYLADRRPAVAAAVDLGRAPRARPRRLARAHRRRRACCAASLAAPRARQRPRSDGPLARPRGGAALRRGSARRAHA